MAQVAGIQNYWPLTWKEVFIRWQATVLEIQTRHCELLAATINNGILIAHCQPFKKGGPRIPQFVEAKDLLPWNRKEKNEVIKIEKEDFAALKQMLF